MLLQVFGHRVLFVQGVTVIVASVGLAVAACVVAERTESSTHEATRYSDAAINAATIEAEVEEFVALGSQELIQAVVASQGGNLSGVPIPTLIEARDLLVDSSRRAEQIDGDIHSAESAELREAAASALTSIDAFYSSPSQDTFGVLSADITALRARSDLLTPQLNAASKTTLTSLRQDARTARIFLVTAALVSGLAVSVATFVLSRYLSKSRDQMEWERDSLIETTRTMERRNDQISALYHVVSEVSESLSTRYVVETAVREARPLVGADLVVLRLLKDDELRLAGVDASDGLETNELSTVPLGDGYAGRSAKRGKTLHIEADAEKDLGESEARFGLQSGVVVPLIVGARVVGTMSAWSKNAHHFSEDDERILEMMATQVATAVAAADTLETSEKNAHLDALTGLFNRRQLAEDINGYFVERSHERQTHSILMIDIDNFGGFNKDFGHRVGDITLQKVAHVLRTTIREQDRVYRYGGEEFLVAMDCPLSEALQIAEHLRGAVAGTPLTGEEMEPVGPVTISVGVASFPTHGEGYDIVCERADQALRASKRNGRNRVTAWTPDLNLEIAA